MADERSWTVESLIEELSLLIQQNDDTLDDEAKTELKHFLDHDEYEYVIEGLALELHEREHRDCAEIRTLWELGKSVGLTADASVLTGDFPAFMMAWAEEAGCDLD